MNIKGIAKEAGVSVATISRVLNHPEVVQPETREHVLEIMKLNNFTPNWFARSLNFGKTSSIALFVPDIDSEKYQMIMSGAETVAHNKKYMLLICGTSNDPQAESDDLDMVLQRKVDGIILADSRLPEQKLKELTKNSIPFVCIGKRQAGGNPDCCSVNYRDGAYRLGSHMIKQGHRSIDLLLSDIDAEESEMIAAGFKQAVEDSGEDIRSKRHEAGFSIAGGYFFAQHMLQAGTLARAVITYNAAQAYGIMKSTQTAGMQIPSELALAAMSETSVSSLVSPALTTIELPNKKLGMIAARMLIDRIEDLSIEEGGQEIILQPKLNIRRSCGNTKFIYELFG